MKVAEQVLGYLWGTSHYALELGGGELGIVAFSDSYHGTGKEGRSVNGFGKIVERVRSDCCEDGKIEVCEIFRM
jgi:hypothetical protein